MEFLRFMKGFKEAVGKKEILDRKEVLKMAIQSAFQGCTRLLKNPQKCP